MGGAALSMKAGGHKVLWRAVLSRTNTCVGFMHCVSCESKQVLLDCPERRKRVIIPSARANFSEEHPLGFLQLLIWMLVRVEGIYSTLKAKRH